MVTPSPTLLLAFSHGYALSYSPAWFYSWLHSLLLSCLLLVMVTPSPTLLLAFIHGYTLSYSPAFFYSWSTFLVFFLPWLHPLLFYAFFLLMITVLAPAISSGLQYLYDTPTYVLSCFYLLLFCFLCINDSALSPTSFHPPFPLLLSLYWWNHPLPSVMLSLSWDSPSPLFCFLSIDD